MPSYKGSTSLGQGDGGGNTYNITNNDVNIVQGGNWEDVSAGTRILADTIYRFEDASWITVAAFSKANNASTDPSDASSNWQLVASDGTDGADGQDGAAGTDGTDGAKGDPGATGAKGEKGDPGDPGQLGVKRVIGLVPDTTYIKTNPHPNIVLNTNTNQGQSDFITLNEWAHADIPFRASEASDLRFQGIFTSQADVVALLVLDIGFRVRRVSDNMVSNWVLIREDYPETLEIGNAIAPVALSSLFGYRVFSHGFINNFASLLESGAEELRVQDEFQFQFGLRFSLVQEDDLDVTLGGTVSNVFFSGLQLSLVVYSEGVVYQDTGSPPIIPTQSGSRVYTKSGSAIPSEDDINSQASDGSTLPIRKILTNPQNYLVVATVATISRIHVNILLPGETVNNIIPGDIGNKYVASAVELIGDYRVSVVDISSDLAELQTGQRIGVYVE